MGTLLEDLEQSSLDIPETTTEKVLKKTALFLTVAFFIFTGMRHLFVPEFYIFLMPKFFPLPLFLIYLSGVYQIACALGLLFIQTRKISAMGLLLFLVGTLPLLVFMWVYKNPVPVPDAPSWLRLLSVPLQFALIFWVYLFYKRPENY